MVAACRLLLVAVGGGSFSGAPPAFSLLAAPQGGWTWFNAPVAIQHNGRIFTGHITGEGHPMAYHIDAATRAVSTPQRLYPAGVFEVDDHDNPAFLRRASDGKILAYFSTHFGTDQYVNVSSAADDASAWAGPTNIASQIGGTRTTYMNPVQLVDEVSDPIYVFFRDHFDNVNPEWAYTKSTDGGATHAAKVSLFRDSGKLTYVKPVVNGGDRVDFVLSGHPEYDSPSSIWHCYYTGGNLYKSDGTLIGAINGGPYGTSVLTQVYDGATTQGWLWDIAIDGSGSPVIAYATFPGNDGSSHLYHRAHWTGAAWVSNQIADGGGHIYASEVERFYSGGVALDHENPDRAWASVETGGTWHLYEYETSDGGSSWTGRLLTSVSGKNIRPMGVRGHTGELAVLFLRGVYETYADFAVGTWGAAA